MVSRCDDERHRLDYFTEASEIFPRAVLLKKLDLRVLDVGGMSE